MIVCVLVATAVYDQGVVGVYTGHDAEQKARVAAEEIWPKTDGHHSFRIDRLEVNKTYERVFDYTPSYRFGGESDAPPTGHDHERRMMVEKIRSTIEVEDRTTSAPPSTTL